ncbi:MAG: YraN family protein [Candidatus Humimicrobiaceae bacterium]
MGKIGEAIACLVLKKKNYRIIEQNFNSKPGEIDIIASIGDILVFIEVKTRTSDDFGSPSESIDANKVSRIRRAASCYLAEKSSEGFDEYRFDIIAIMAKKNILRVTLRKIKSDETSASSIMEIATDLFDSCIIEHIEAAF